MHELKDFQQRSFACRRLYLDCCLDIWA